MNNNPNYNQSRLKSNNRNSSNFSNSSSNEVKKQPFIVFFTSHGCHVCENFRGNGRLSDDKEWNKDFVFKCFFGRDNNSDVSLCSKIVEIHNENRTLNNDDISEINFYFMIRYNMEINEDFIEYLFQDELRVHKNEHPVILRISLTKFNVGRFIISSDINCENDERCEKINRLMEDYFVWNLMANDFRNLRNHFNCGNTSFDVCLSEEVKNDNIYRLVSEDYNKYKKYPGEFDEILRNRHDFKWLLGKMLPRKLRDLQSYYPCWMLILPEEWGKGIESNNPIYSRVVGSDTNFDGVRYKSTQPIRNEKIYDIVTMYHLGRVELTREETNEKIKKSVTFG